MTDCHLAPSCKVPPKNTFHNVTTKQVLGHSFSKDLAAKIQNLVPHHLGTESMHISIRTFSGEVVIFFAPLCATKQVVVEHS